jgi:hypothetical protein
MLRFLIASQLFNNAVSTSGVVRHVAKFVDFYELCVRSIDSEGGGGLEKLRELKQDRSLRRM